MVRRLAQSVRDPRLAAVLHRQLSDFEAQLALWSGDFPVVERWIEQRGLSPRDRPSTLWWGYHQLLATYLITRSRAEQDATQLAEVVDLLLHLLRVAHTKGFAGIAVGLSPQLVQVHYLLGNLNQALLALEQALILAQPGGYMRSFLNEGQPIRLLLVKALRRDIVPDYTRKLVAAFADESQTQTGISLASHQAQGVTLTPT